MIIQLTFHAKLNSQIATPRVLRGALGIVSGSVFIGGDQVCPWVVEIFRIFALRGCLKNQGDWIQSRVAASETKFMNTVASGTSSLKDCTGNKVIPVLVSVPR